MFVTTLDFFRDIFRLFIQSAFEWSKEKIKRKKSRSEFD
jgi:cation transport regulator ChaB